MEEACLITWVYYLPLQSHSSDIINVSLFMKDMLCFYKKHIQETKKMTYLNIFLIVFEQERTRRKKERITPPLLPVSLVVKVQYFLSSRSPEKRNKDKMIIQYLSYTYTMK